MHPDVAGKMIDALSQGGFAVSSKVTPQGVLA
jgi:hypothetical protein